MQNFLSLFLILILVIIYSVEAIGSRRIVPHRYPSTSTEVRESRRNRALSFLERSLNVALENRKLEISKVVTSALKHEIVIKGREEMYKLYDQYLERQCQDEDEISGKKKAVRKGWKVLGKYVFELDRLDMHNGCFTAGINFPSVIYD